MAAKITPPDYKGYDSWYTPDYLPPPPITAAELAERIGSEGQHGTFLISSYIKWIEDKVPVDRYGFRQIYDEKALAGWRHHMVSKVIHAADTFRDMARMMNDKNSYLGQSDDRLQERTDGRG